MPLVDSSGDDYTPFGGGGPPGTTMPGVGGGGLGGGFGFGAGGAYGLAAGSHGGDSVMARLRRRLAARAGMSPYTARPYQAAQNSQGGQGAPAGPFGGEAMPAAMGNGAGGQGENPFTQGFADQSQGQGGVPAGPLTGNYWESIDPNAGHKFSYTDVGRQLLQGFIRGGYLDPRGSQDMIAALRGRALQDYGDAQHRADTTADLYAGDDPSLRAFAHTHAELQGGSDLYRNLMAAQLQSMVMNQDRISQLVNMGFQNNYQPRVK